MSKKSVRRDLSAAVRSGALAIALVSGTAAFAGTGEDTIAVAVDQAKLVKMPPRIATLVVGNPLIATSVCSLAAWLLSPARVMAPPM